VSTNRYLGVNEYSTLPVEPVGKYSSRWAIPRVDPQEKIQSTKKRRQINNLAILFVIYVFKQAKKALSAK